MQGCTRLHRAINSSALPCFDRLQRPLALPNASCRNEHRTEH